MTAPAKALSQNPDGWQAVQFPRGEHTFACAVEVKDTSMATGTVKWFNPQEAGFIQPSGGHDVTTLVERQKVSYDVVRRIAAG